jgi:cephalosporin-C deacetylase
MCVQLTTGTSYESWFPDAEFDATHGFGMADMLAIVAPSEPPGFADFWTDLFASAQHVPPRPVTRQIASDGGVDIHDVEFSSLGDVRLGGWLAVPSDGRIDRAMVVSHGYDGRAAPDLRLIPERTAAVFPCARGLPARGHVAGIPAVAAEHVLHGIAAKETYVHAGCAADIWCAAAALLALLPTAPQRLDYVGGSFGGGIGALALPWDSRFDSAILTVPSFGHHDLRLTMRCTASGEAVRQHVARHPGARDVLRYFDAATAATRLTIPTLVAPALWDPAVPPPGQFAVYNALAGPKKLYVMSAGHADYPGMEAEDAGFVAAAKRFLA